MPILDDIQKMKQQGLQDQDIIMSLREQGHSPRDISDALSQIKIKAAVAEPGTQVQDMPGKEMAVEGGGLPAGQGYVNPATQEMQPSIMPKEGVPEVPAPMPVEQVPAEMPQEVMPAPLAEEGAYPPTPEMPEAAPAEYYQPYGGIGVENISEIIDHILEEKLDVIRKQVDEIVKEKKLSDAKVTGVDERLKKIEKIIQLLQIKILEKVASYGKSVDEIKHEIHSMEDSFGKIINPLLGRTREVIEEKRHGDKKTKGKLRSKTSDRKRKDSDGFESYIRQ